MNHDEILQHFQDAGWVDGMKTGALRDRIENALKHINKVADQRREGLQRFMERRDFGSPFDDDIEGVVGDLLTDFAIPEIIGDVSELRSEIARVVRRLIDRAMATALRESGTSESPTDPLTIAAFMRFVCGHDTFEDAMEARRAKQLKVRPYELFLFACQQDFETKKLTRLRKDLAKDFIPQPEYTSSLSIMVAHGGAEAALKQWETEDEERLRERENAETATSKKRLLERLEQREQEEAAAQLRITTTTAKATERLRQATSDTAANIGGRLAVEILAWLVEVGGLKMADEEMAAATERVADMMAGAIKETPKKKTAKKAAKKKSARRGSGESGR